MQYQKKTIKSQKNEFGDKNNFETVPNRAQIFHLINPPGSARYHYCLMRNQQNLMKESRENCENHFLPKFCLKGGRNIFFRKRHFFRLLEG